MASIELELIALQQTVAALRKRVVELEEVIEKITEKNHRPEYTFISYPRIDDPLGQRQPLPDYLSQPSYTPSTTPSDFNRVWC